MADPVYYIESGTGGPPIPVYKELGVPVPAFGRVTNQVYWWRQHYTNAATGADIVNTFFGGSNNIWQSNCQQPNQIPGGREFVINAISFKARYFYDQVAYGAGTILPAVIYTMRTLWQNILDGVLVLRRGTTDHYEWPLDVIGEKYDDFIQTWGNIGAANDYFHEMFGFKNRAPYPLDDFGGGLLLKTNEVFQIDIHLPATVAVAVNQHLFLKCELHGREMVGVQ